MILPAIAHAVSPYRQLLVGFSGGLDSTVLLHRLKLWRDREPDVQLRAMHIHHGLSPHADDWVAHCEAVCSGWEIPLIVERVTLEDEGLGIEAQARKARYAAFSGALQPGEALVTAQHLDDQCETFLLALKRGSGPAGLSAMPERADFAETGAGHGLACLVAQLAHVRKIACVGCVAGGAEAVAHGKAQVAVAHHAVQFNQPVALLRHLIGPAGQQGA